MSTTTTNRKKQLLNTVTVNLGCSCRRPKLSSIFNPKPKHSLKTPKYQKHHNNSSYNNYTTTTPWGGKTVISSSNSPVSFSPYVDTTTTSSSTSSHPSTVDGFGRVKPKSSVAVEKESNDPYLDFRQSMLQMIVENHIYSRDDLRELLNCFLQLNSPSLHGVIIRVFTEIWNGFYFSARSNDMNYSYYNVRRPKSYEI